MAVQFYSWQAEMRMLKVKRAGSSVHKQGGRRLPAATVVSEAGLEIHGEQGDDQEGHPLLSLRRAPSEPLNCVPAKIQEGRHHCEVELLTM